MQVKSCRQTLLFPAGDQLLLFYKKTLSNVIYDVEYSMINVQKSSCIIISPWLNKWCSWFSFAGCFFQVRNLRSCGGNISINEKEFWVVLLSWVTPVYCCWWWCYCKVVVVVVIAHFRCQWPSFQDYPLKCTKEIPNSMWHIVLGTYYMCVRQFT